MTYEELIAYYGTQVAAARAVGIKPPSVAEWKERGIPIPRQCQYEVLTGGELKADKVAA